MASIYENIKTAKDLLFEVKAHGLSLKTEDLVAAQDIFGNSSEGELIELANANNTRATFYQVLYNIWHWEDATRFYNNHSNPLFEKAMEEAKKVKVLEEKLEEERTEREGCLELRRERDSALGKLSKAEKEIVVLKAKLYDMMIERQENNK